MGREGAALLFVLVVILLLSVLIIELGFLMRMDNRLIAYWESERAAFHLGKGGLRMAEYFIEEDSPLVDSLNDIWAQEFPPVSMPGATVEFRVSDEDGKINVNRLVDNQGRMNERLHGVLSRLLALSDKNPGLADEIAERLRAAGGVRFATKKELTAWLPELEDVISCLTVYSDGMININTAPLAVIRALSQGIDPALAEEITIRRAVAPFGSVSQVGRVQGMDENIMKDLSGLIKVRSGVFEVTVLSSSGAVSRKTVAVVERRRGGSVLLYFRSV